MKIKSHLDFEQIAQLLKVKIHNAANHTNPALPAVAGGLYFNTTNDVLMWGDGTAWHEMSDVSAFIDLLVANDGIKFTAGNGTNGAEEGETLIDIDEDSAIFEFTGTAPDKVLSIKNNGVALGKLAQIAKLKVLGRPDAAGSDPADVTTVTVDTSIPGTEPTDHDSLPTTKAVWNAVDSVAGDIPGIAAGDGIAITESDGTHTIAVDPNTDQFDESFPSDKLTIKEDGITGTELQNDSEDNTKRAVDTHHIKNGAVTTAKINDGDVTFGKLATASYIKSTPGDGLAGTVNDTTLATSKAIRDYIDGTVGDLGTLVGGWDADTQTAFPSHGEGATTKGDYWYVTDAGTIEGIAFTVGSMMIAKVDEASTSDAGDWIFLISKMGEATTSKLGLVKYATQAEVDVHEDIENGEDKVVRSNTLKSKITAPGGSDNPVTTVFGKDVKRQYAINIGNGAATSIGVTHGFGTDDVKVEVVENATKETVIADVSRTNTNTVNIGFAAAPASNAYRVIVTA